MTGAREDLAGAEAQEPHSSVLVEEYRCNI
jgi:hypothetical protein